MNLSHAKLKHRAHIANLTPGRVRFKLHSQSRQALAMTGMQADLQSREGVQAVKVNPANGSVTLHFDPHRNTPPGILRPIPARRHFFGQWQLSDHFSIADGIFKSTWSWV